VRTRSWLDSAPPQLSTHTAVARSSSWVKVCLTLDEERQAVLIRTEAQTVGPTGVEMEALTGAARRT
jgi:molybdenum cofactor biosynthesis enzyme